MTYHRSFLAALMLAVMSVTTVCAQDGARMRRAWEAYSTKRFAEAKVILDSVTVNDAMRVDYLKLRGVILQGLNANDSLIATGKELVRVAPNNVFGWYFQAVGRYSNDDLLGFIPNAKKVCEIDPAMGRETRFDLVLVSLGQDQIGLRDSVFKTNEGQIGIALSKAWSTQHIDDGKSLNWFVSLEPISKPTDVFSVGLTLRWHRKISRAIRLYGSTDSTVIIRTWNTYADSLAVRSGVYRDSTLDSSWVTMDGWSGTQRLRTRTIVDKNSPIVGHSIVMFDISVTKKGDVITLVLEAPTNQRKVWEPRFRASLASVKLPYGS